MSMRYMSSVRVVPMFFLLAGVMAPIGGICAQDDADTESAAPLASSFVHVRARELSSESNGTAFLNVDFSSGSSAAFPVPFNVEVLAPKDIGIIDAIFRIVDFEGRRVADISIKTSAGAGSTPLRFLWEGSELDDGDYAGSIEIFQTGTKALARRTFVVTKRSGDRVEATLLRAAEAVAKLGEHAGGAAPPPYIEGRLAIATAALARAEESSNDLFSRHDAALYALHTTEELRARWALGTVSLDGPGASEAPSLEGLASAEGGLRVAEGPVFLGGLAVHADAAQAGRVAEYRLNFATVYAGPGESALVREIAEAAGDRVALLSLFSMDAVPDGELEAIAGSLETSGAQLAWGFVDAPPIDIMAPQVLEGFVERVTSTYKDRYELNRMWRKRFKGFDEIEIWPDYQRRSYQYDWQMYKMALRTSAAFDVLARTRGAESSLALTIALDDGLLRPGETRRGVDQETLALAFELGVLETHVFYADPLFGMQYPEQSMLLALRKSFAPDAPLAVVHRIDTRDPGALYGRDLTKDIHASVWESAIEGAAAFALDLREAPDLREISGAAEFEAIEGLLAATLEINRTVAVLDAFRQDRPTVRILWSDSARILDDGEEHLASVRRAYAGSSFGGHKVGFLTERQLARGEWEGIRLLLIPHTPALSSAAFSALQELIDTGIAIIRSMSSMPYDSRGDAQNDVLVFGPKTTLARGGDASGEYMEAMDEAISRGRVRNVPRVVNHSGYPVEGVKTRYVELDGNGYLYVINLRKEPVTCTLSVGESAGWDVIQGRAVDFPRAIEPLRPMLIRLGYDGPRAVDSDS